MWGTVLNPNEKESFFKAFLIFFVYLLGISTLALYLYTNEQERFYHEKMLSTMDAFSYSLTGLEFNYNIIPFSSQEKVHELIITNKEIYALFPLPTNPHAFLIKVMYPYNHYLKAIQWQKQKALILFLIITGISALLSVVFARYSLAPLRKTLGIMEDFLKDIIHDLNTPISSILLNSQLLKRKYNDEEIDRIYISGQTINNLYKNFEVLYRELPIQEDNLIIDIFLRERIRYFQALYPALTFSLNGDLDMTISINQEILMRIVDNLLSNACKYNRKNGRIDIYYNKTSLHIIDTGIGIKNIDKVFNRFYKETQRGLGIGLHIVQTLSQKIGLKVLIQSKDGIGTDVKIVFPAGIKD